MVDATCPSHRARSCEGGALDEARARTSKSVRLWSVFADYRSSRARLTMTDALDTPVTRLRRTRPADVLPICRAIFCRDAAPHRLCRSGRLVRYAARSHCPTVAHGLRRSLLHRAADDHPQTGCEGLGFPASNSGRQSFRCMTAMGDGNMIIAGPHRAMIITKLLPDRPVPSEVEIKFSEKGCIRAAKLDLLENPPRPPFVVIVCEKNARFRTRVTVDASQIAINGPSGQILNRPYLSRLIDMAKKVGAKEAAGADGSPSSARRGRKQQSQERPA